MAVLTVATCQFPVSADIGANLHRVKRQMVTASRRGARVAHFPEGALSGYAGTDFETFAGFGWDRLGEVTGRGCRAGPAAVLASAAQPRRRLAQLKERLAAQSRHNLRRSPELRQGAVGRTWRSRCGRQRPAPRSWPLCPPGKICPGKLGTYGSAAPFMAPRGLVVKTIHEPGTAGIEYCAGLAGARVARGMQTASGSRRGTETTAGGGVYRSAGGKWP